MKSLKYLVMLVVVLFARNLHIEAGPVDRMGYINEVQQDVMKALIDAEVSLEIVWSEITQIITPNKFQPLEAVGRGSETQLLVGWKIKLIKIWIYLIIIERFQGIYTTFYWR